jgi:hypothetical protein
VNDPDEFSPPERRALAQWRVPVPAADFSARVLARLEGERTAPRAVRQVAVAALAVAVVAGFLAFRRMSTGSSSYGAAHVAADGGSGLEVNPLSDVNVIRS